MQTYKISISDTKKFYENLGCDIGGISILSKNIKTSHFIYKKYACWSCKFFKARCFINWC